MQSNEHYEGGVAALQELVMIIFFSFFDYIIKISCIFAPNVLTPLPI